MNFTHALGWTLLHSLWQGLILALVAIVALRLIPSRYSSARYLVSTATLALMLVAGVCTFATLLSQSSPAIAMPVTQPAFQTAPGDAQIWLTVAHAPSAPPVSALDVVYTFIQSHLQLITLTWVVGVLFFSLRIAGGFWYLSRVRSNAMPVGDVWTEHLRQLCIRMGISDDVALAESAEVQSPFVIGYFKPLILIPLGMIGGLSTDQLETILLHELSHIRRADYLVNIIQSFIEALFFFNPFVWIVSSMVRTEREHCCDDAVVRHGYALTYAQALASVEALRFANTSLAMSLAGNKNQLLKRIKRIMEKSVQHYSVRERMVPVVLLVVGLACASWMTLKPEQQQAPEESTAAGMLASDTTKPGSKSYSRRQIIRFDAQGKPHEQVIERYESDDEHHEVEVHDDFDIEVPEFQEFDMPIAIQIPSFDFHMAPMAPMPPMEPFEPMEITIPPMPPIQVWGGDTLMPPGVHTFQYSTGDMNHDEWTSFSADFQSRFKDQFEDFYKEHSKEMESMMKEMAEEYARNAKEYAHNFDHYATVEVPAAEMAKHQAELARKNADHYKAIAEQQREVHERLEADLHKFEEAIKVELVKDGYLKNDEPIKSMNWDNTGDIIINGKKIKDSDKDRYNSIHDKFFKKGDVRVEE